MDDEVLARFEAWFKEEIKDDPEFAGCTSRSVIQWAKRQRPIRGEAFLDAMIKLQSAGKSFREFYAINCVPTAIQFPTVRRKGGDHDRGFSLALNLVMKRAKGSD